jgi:HAD superfamily hydrolase (TIGR01509 family)
MNRALLFDCDGTLAETEEQGHRVAFNRMWREFGVPWSWGVEEYGRKLAISGGRDRMASLYDDPAFRQAFDLPADQEAWQKLLLAWHQRKSAIYQEMISTGQIPPRPGVQRLIQEALEAGWQVGVCSGSAPDSVRTVLKHVLGQEIAERFDLVLGGDMVKHKKPDPEIYTLAARTLGLPPERCLVVEDARIGLLAAKQAGAKCLITVSRYTQDEDFAEADMVVSCLGDPDGEPCRVLANRCVARPAGHVTSADLERMLDGARTTLPRVRAAA